VITHRDGLVAPARGAGARSITYLGHATTLLSFGDVQVVTDPVLTGRVAFIRRVAAGPAAALGGPELILISHAHQDHLHRPSLRMLDPAVPVIVPPGLGALVRGWGRASVRELPVGESLDHRSLTVTAVRAEHSGFRPPLGPRAEAIGYVIRNGGVSIYFAGDTAMYPEMSELAGIGLDVALLPVWGWGPTLGPGHLDPEQAAQAAALLEARVVIPIHWGTLWPTALRWRRDRLVDPPHQFAAAVRKAAPRTRVVVLAPGESCGVEEAA
jgi:L-ascorbate metabolism protein UlaG (beta-lactamase superfamily)